jgi:hypothetical protein
MPTPLVGDTVTDMDLSRPRPAAAELDVSDVLIGLTLATAGRARAGWRFGQRALRPVVGLALRPPLLPDRLQPVAWLQAPARVGRAYRLRSARQMQQAVPTVADAVLDRLDLTSIVLERVKLNQIIDEVEVDRIVARVDLDEIAARLDLEAVIDRIDLAALAREVIEEIDLPEIVRESTGIMTSEAVVGIRVQGIQADEGVNRIVDRLLLRRGVRKTQLRRSPGDDDETQH